MTGEFREFADGEKRERFESEHPEAYMRRRDFLGRTAALAGLAGLASALPTETLISQAAKVQTRVPFPSPSNMPVDTFVVLMMENRSFDHYLGAFEGADGKNAGLSYPDDNGQLHPTHQLAPDFQGCSFHDPDHSWDGGRRQYNNGKLNGFRKSPNDEFAIGYYNEADVAFTPHLAKAFTLYDRYFCSIMAETWPNRNYQHSAQAGGVRENGSPADAVTGGLTGDGLYQWETIWDLLKVYGVSCRYYFSDLPYIGVFGRRYLDIVAPVAQFYVDAALGRLPHVAFVDPPFLDGGGGNGLSGDEHPHGDIRIGQAFQSSIVHSFMQGPQFKHGALFVNYDEWGGFFDHVPPHFVPDDRQSSALSENWGMTGFRTPTVAISPYARRGEVNHAATTHESILKLISYRFGLPYLNKRHRYASNIGRTFDWENPDFTVPSLPSPLPPLTTACAVQSNIPATDPASVRARRNQPMEFSSPEFHEYLERMGYPVNQPKANEVFNDPKVIDRMKQIWKQ